MQDVLCLDFLELDEWQQAFENPLDLPEAVHSQLRHAVIAIRDVPDAEHLPYPHKRLRVPRILIEADRRHEAMTGNISVFPLLYLQHNASVTVKKSRNICPIDIGSTSHGIVLLFHGPQVIIPYAPDQGRIWLSTDHAHARFHRYEPHYHHGSLHEVANFTRVDSPQTFIACNR